MIRSFIALHVAEVELVERLLATRLSMKRLHGLKWVPSHQLHFTLKFLGSIDEARVPAAREALEGAARSISAFDYTLEGLGVFPPRGPARTLWAGVTAGREALVGLAESVERAFVVAGFTPEERPFSPHLTLARVKDPAVSRDVSRALPSFGAPLFGTARAKEIVLFGSELTREGPIHRSLAGVALAT